MKRKIATIITMLLCAVLLLAACGEQAPEIFNKVQIKNHTVTYDADGGVLEGKSSVTVQSYSTLNLPVPKKEGYVFTGWFVGEGINEAQFTSATLVTSDVTLKAKWAKAEYTVTFIDYYGNVISRETVKYGETASEPAVPRVDEKCLRFDRWDTDISKITSDLTVKALYVIDSYTITYVTNSQQTIPTTSYFFDETPVVPPSPALSGHYFIGWYLDEEFTTEYKFDAPLTSDITLYAYFNESIPISTLEDLLAIPEYSASNYFLKNDIDCEGSVITTSITGFAGTLDGDGHKIHNFVFQPTGAENTGLFATNGGTIKNITFDNFSYTLTNTNLNSNVGFLIGTNSGTVENIHISNASLSYTHIRSGGGSNTSYYGGIAGENKGKVINCSVLNSTLYLKAQTSSWWNSGTASSYLYGAALIGRNGGNIQDSEVDISTTVYNLNDCSDTYGSGNGSYIGLGGLVSINNGTVKNCNTALNATASTNNFRTMETYVGGLVYKNNADIEGCSADTTVSLKATYSCASAAGFVENNTGNIKNSYAKVSITNVNSNSIFGGFAAYNSGGIYRCYTSGEMTVGDATVGKGGFAGYNNGSINASFAAVNIVATNAALYGPFIGNADTASFATNCYYSIKSTFITNGEPQLFDVTYAEVADPVLNLSDENFLVGTLGWSAEVWSFDANKLNYPTLK